MSYTLYKAKRYFDFLGPFLFLPNLLDSRVYSRLVHLGGLDSCGHILELGAGVGTLARKILQQNIRSSLRLILLELSDSNLAILARRFKNDRGRVILSRVDGPPPYGFESGSFDRFVSCFVLEVMDPVQRMQNIDEAHRLLKPGGLLCCVAVTRGNNWVSRATMLLAEGLSRMSRWLVLGAQFCNFTSHFAAAKWRIVHQETMSSVGFASLIMIVEKLDHETCELDKKNPHE